MPVAIQQSYSYGRRTQHQKGKTGNREVSKLHEQRQLMNGLWASLNLPAAMEDSSGVNVSKRVRQKAANIKLEGGLDVLEWIMASLPDMLQRNNDILNECDRLVQEELTSDEQLKGQYGRRWNRMPSSQMSEPLRNESLKYRAMVSKKEKADAIVREKYQKHVRAMYLLSSSEQELVQSIANKSAEQRETALEDLAAACDAFVELKADLNEGAKFYGDLAELLLKFQSRIGDFCFARNAEREDLLRVVQANIINKPHE